VLSKCAGRDNHSSRSRPRRISHLRCREGKAGKKRKLGIVDSQSHVTSEETRRPRRGLQACDRTGFAATFRGNDEEAASPSTRSADRATIDPSPELASRDDPRRKSDDAWTKMTETCTAPREDDSRGEQANTRERERDGRREREREREGEQVARDRGREAPRRAHARLTLQSARWAPSLFDGAIGRPVACGRQRGAFRRPSGLERLVVVRGEKVSKMASYQ